MKNLLFVGVLAVITLCSSCSSYQSISNGGYSDVSLNRNSNEYELKRLEEISADGKALFGIPMKAKKKQGTVVRFNGVDLGKSNQLLPILTMIGYTAITGFAINEIGGTKFDNNSFDVKDNIGLLPSFALALPVAAILNNYTWSGSALQNASWNLNSELLEKNPDIDIFLNPKYEIEFEQGVFTQKAKVKAKVMGATILTD